MTTAKNVVGKLGKLKLLPATARANRKVLCDVAATPACATYRGDITATPTSATYCGNVAATPTSATYCGNVAAAPARATNYSNITATPAGTADFYNVTAAPAGAAYLRCGRLSRDSKNLKQSKSEELKHDEVELIE